MKVARKEIEGRDREMRKLGEKLGGKEGNREERKAHIVKMVLPINLCFARFKTFVC